MFKPPALIGFRLVRAHTDNQDAAFHAVAGLTTGCLATADAIGRHDHSVLYVPIIVVDWPLVGCHLPEGTTDPELTEVQQGFLLHRPGSDHTIVHIVHINALTDFLTAAKRDAATLNKLVAPFAVLSQYKRLPESAEQIGRERRKHGS